MKGYTMQSLGTDRTLRPQARRFHPKVWIKVAVWAPNPDSQPIKVYPSLK